ncbi:MAG TPA: 3-oxoacyl-[acyl-carrier-protein] reductase [Gemmatimonadales bacterium]|nr:3-oxoacyl-[acyl-carrier-protein] reductase [Gemmatimonadales bacterium]
MNQIDLAARTALVTGGSKGIGQAIAGALYGAGARVAIVARNGARAELAARALGERARGYSCDVTDGERIATTLEAVERDLGPVDILVNNAGLTKDNLLFRIGEPDWDLVLDTNLKGAFLFTKAAARGMIKRRWGRVVNITSVIGLMGNKGQANYAASKAGLIGFTRSVAKELGSRNVLVNAVAPGYIDTELTQVLTEEQRQALFPLIALGRLGQGADVAGAVLFLASEMASYITGQVLVVDGGMVM